MLFQNELPVLSSDEVLNSEEAKNKAKSNKYHLAKVIMLTYYYGSYGDTIQVCGKKDDIQRF